MFHVSFPEKRIWEGRGLRGPAGKSGLCCVPPPHLESQLSRGDDVENSHENRLDNMQ